MFMLLLLYLQILHVSSVHVVMCDVYAIAPPPSNVPCLISTPGHV